MTALEMRNRIHELENELRALRALPMDLPSLADEDHEYRERLEDELARYRKGQLTELELQEVWGNLSDEVKSKLVDDFIEAKRDEEQ